MGWRDNLRNPKNLGAIKGPHGHASQPHLSVHAKGGRIGRPGKRKDFKTHGRDVPTLAAKGGRIGLQYGGPPNRGRTNLLEQLGRVEGERSNPNRRAEISRVHGELNRGYAIGGVVKKTIKKLRPGVFKPKKKAFKTHGKDVPTMAAEGGRIGLKKGGSDKNWIQKAVNPKHKGYCTPMTKKTCTPARKALARTFKKQAKTGW